MADKLRRIEIGFDGGQVVAVRVFVTAPPDPDRPASLPGRFVVRSGDIRTEARTVFLSGALNPQ